MSFPPLDKRCRVEYPVETVTNGVRAVDWSLLGVRFCNVLDEPPSKSEMLKQGAVIAAQRTRVQLNYCSDINSSMRLIVMRPNPVTYQMISPPAELGNKERIEVMCEAYSA